MKDRRTKRELREEIRALKRENRDLYRRNQGQARMLAQIRVAADKATGVDRSRNEPRGKKNLAGAEGAVTYLIERYEALGALGVRGR